MTRFYLYLSIIPIPCPDEIKMGAKKDAALEGPVADAGEAFGQPSQREGSAAHEGLAADAGEAVRQAGQYEGGAAVEGSLADADEAVG